MERVVTNHKGIVSGSSFGKIMQLCPHFSWPGCLLDDLQ